MYNVIIYDPNRRIFKPYDVIPYFIDCYNYATKKPNSFKEFREFVKREGMYMYWGRCQYEIILTDWPCQAKQEKWDVWDQIDMNLDTVVKILMEKVKNLQK